MEILITMITVITIYSKQEHHNKNDICKKDNDNDNNNNNNNNNNDQYVFNITMMIVITMIINMNIILTMIINRTP